MEKRTLKKAGLIALIIFFVEFLVFVTLKNVAFPDLSDKVEGWAMGVPLLTTLSISLFLFACCIHNNKWKRITIAIILYFEICIIGVCIVLTVMEQ